MVSATSPTTRQSIKSFPSSKAQHASRKTESTGWTAHDAQTHHRSPPMGPQVHSGEDVKWRRSGEDTVEPCERTSFGALGLHSIHQANEGLEHRPIVPKGFQAHRQDHARKDLAYHDPPPPPSSVDQDAPLACRTSEVEIRLDAVVILNSSLTLTNIIPLDDPANAFGDRGSVLDKACLTHPFLDFVHPDDREPIREAVYCAMLTRSTLPHHHPHPHRLEGVSDRITTRAQMLSYLCEDFKPRGVAICRLKEIGGSYTRFRMIIRNDPTEVFRPGENSLLVGIQRMDTLAGSSARIPPPWSARSDTRSDSDKRDSVRDSPSDWGSSLTSSTGLPAVLEESPGSKPTLPSFSVLAAGIHVPHEATPGYGRDHHHHHRPGLSGTIPSPGAASAYELQALSISGPAPPPPPRTGRDSLSVEHFRGFPAPGNVPLGSTCPPPTMPPTDSPAYRRE